jgi:hypothetical protein
LTHVAGCLRSIDASWLVSSRGCPSWKFRSILLHRLGAARSRFRSMGRPPPALLPPRRGRLVKNAYGSCARVRGGERSAFCPMVCAHGRRQRREVARMDMRSYNEQVKRGCAPIRPGGRVPRHWAYTVPTLHLTRIACPSATWAFVVLVRLDPTEEEPCGTC